jgi:hypothetical protein
MTIPKGDIAVGQLVRIKKGLDEIPSHKNVGLVVGRGGLGADQEGSDLDNSLIQVLINGERLVFNEDWIQVLEV